EQIKASQRILKKLRKAAYKAHTWPTIYLIICQAYFIYYLFTAFGRGDLQVDNLLMSIGLSYQLIMTIELAVGDFAFYIAYQMSFMADYYEFMENPELLPPSGDRLMPEGPLSIEFKNLYFRYPGCENYVLENLNMKIEAGETVALVGDNGAGKSSLIKLLVGLYRPNSGEILINGIKLDDFNIRERKKIFNPVFQSVLLWPVTLKENVAGTEQNIDIARVWDSLEKCGLKERVEAMPHGLDTLLDRAIDPEAIDLSGGESQKLAIARAVYKDGPVTILDEPTAALDALAEAEIYENLHSISVAKTSIYISHRLSSTKFCDRIFLLADRAVAEFGSHAELMALGGRYHEIFLTQGKYYQEEQEARNANA
ncbi:MAG: ABC transporter ATP-binding protein, partial [Eubacteriales bacterium]|nr:ABC transporter ATP-binding protein [Eubacteriales bacterium]